METLNRQRHGNKKYLYLVELYKEQHDVETVTLDEVTDWAIKEGHYIPEPVDQRKILKREIARAMRTDYFVDDQGREVRKYHSVRHTDGERSWSEWATLKNADPGHMRVSFQQRRQYILSGCRQHKLDFDSFNDNNVFGATLPLFSYNFDPDMEELSLPTDYPMERPETDEDDGEE